MDYQDYEIPKNLIFNTPELVADVIKYPDTYAYPFITTLFTIRNSISENKRFTCIGGSSCKDAVY